MGSAVAPGTTLAADWRTSVVPLPPSALERLVPADGTEYADATFVRSTDARGQLVAWPRGTSDRTASSIVRIRTGSDRPGTEYMIPHEIDAIASDEKGRGLVLTSRDAQDGARGSRKQPGLWATPTSPGGKPGRTQRLGSAALWGPSAVAVNARGDAVVAWLESYSIRLRAVTRRAGGQFGRVQTLARADRTYAQIGDYAVSISESGRALVAYGTNVQGSTDQALAWTGNAGGNFGSMQELGRMTVTSSEEELGAAITAGFDGAGRGFVGWGGPKRQSPVSVASIAPGAARFSKAVTVDPGVRKDGTDWSYQGASLGALDSGGALFAWTSPQGDVRAAAFNASGALTRTQRLAGTDGAAVIGGSGQLAVVASDRKDGSPQLWRPTGSQLRFLGPLPPTPSDEHLPTYDFDPAGRFRVTSYGVSASGNAELRAARVD